jgi:hypothetical protein
MNTMARVNVRVDVDCMSISSLYLTFPILSASDEVTAAERGLPRHFRSKVVRDAPRRP